MIIKWFGHACFQIISDDYSLVIDPFTGVPGLPDPLIDANAVYASHGHFDHNYFDAVKIREYPKPSPITVKTIPCFHDNCGGKERGENLIHVFHCEDMNIVHLGDLGHLLNDEQIAEILPCDVLLVPIGGFYTIDSAKAYDVCKQLSPQIIIPMHYKYNGRGLEKVSGPEEFLSLFPSDMIIEYDEPEINISKDTDSHIAFLR